jgi:phosphoglucomutase
MIGFGKGEGGEMKIKERYQKWIDSSYLSERDRVSLLKITEGSEIKECFGSELTFGTGGMRGELGLGPNRMNRYMVGKVVQAVMTHLREGKDEPRVIIAFDTRRMSRLFADEAARVALANGARVFVFDGERPVPELSFAVRKLQADIGIMITASHNPPEYNGVKLYGADGAQLVPERIQPIIDAFSAIPELALIHRDHSNRLSDHPKFSYLSEEMDEFYVSYCLSQKKRNDIDCTLKVVYTPLHGAGNRLVRRVLARRGYQNVWTVTSQERPDPDFSTVTTPNPEESEAMRLAVELAKKRGADLVIATDPDCDRVGVVVMDQGEPFPLNGNQIGALLLNYLINQTQDIPKGATVVKTIVTSDLGRRIAEKNGLVCEETLTGFKYIGEKIESFQSIMDRSFFFGYEESYGYLTGNQVRDKDGVLAAMLIVEMASFYCCHGVSLRSHLQEIYHDFGFYKEALDSFESKGLKGQEKIQGIMDHFRTRSPFAESQIKMIDYLSLDTGLPSENVIKVFFEAGWVAIRPSGTEPKLKCYYSTWADSQADSDESMEMLQKQMREFIHAEFDK